jgi:hypothetical protein
MRFMLLLYGAPARPETLPPAIWQRVVAAHTEFTRKLVEAGALIASAPLAPPESAKTVRLLRRERLVVDGPFADTKEVLGGYYLIEAESLDDAVRWAYELEPVEEGSIEVRPLLEVGVDSGPSRSS